MQNSSPDLLILMVKKEIRRMKRFTWLGIFIVLSLVLAACGAAEPTAEPVAEPTEAPAEEPVEEAEEMAEANSIVDIAVEDGRFTTLVAAVQAAGLAETLSGEGQFTVFAPTDEAFAALPEGTVESLLEEPEGALQDILLYHVVDGAVPAETVVTLESATTLQGEDVAIEVMDGEVVLNDNAKVIITDIEASNGIIHVIDAVILPPSMSEAAAKAEGEMAEEGMMEAQSIAEIAAADGRFTTLLAALEAAGLAETFAGEGAFTVFAPTDEAFAALPEGTVDSLLADPQGALTDVLTYHVVEGVVPAETVVGLDSATTLLGEDLSIMVVEDEVILNEMNKVIAADIEASNGIIHVIDGVLLPPSSAESAAEPTIVDIAVEDGRFTTLVAALEAAGLVETLSGEGPFTVFAPVDEAFAALPEGTVESLLEDPEGALTDVLLYHVVDGEVMAEDVVGLTAAPTLLGQDITVAVDGDGQVLLNGTVQVILTDVQASNGVIHVIDGVLIPAE
jgi:uncharacterized surface protein with fasciclin (FAS1) repeats